MSSLAQTKYPEPLVDLVAKIEELLIEDHGVAANEAKKQAWAIVNLIAVDWAGQQIYIGRGVVVSERDRAVVRDLDSGLHPSALAKKYEMTERQIHNIRNRVRAEELAFRQLALFG